GAARGAGRTLSAQADSGRRAMSDLFDHLDHRRAIIDRRALAGRLDEIAAETSDTGQRRRAMVALLKDVLDAGRAEIERRLLDHPSAGRLAANATAFLI